MTPTETLPVNSNIRPIDDTTDSQADRQPWLVMLYLAGDNNLSEDMVLSLQDFLPVGSVVGASSSPGRRSGDAIVAQFDPSGMGLATQRYDFSDPTGKKTLEEFRVPGTYAETNTGNPETLKEFINWALDKDPNQKMNYLLILSGHGSGTTDEFLERDENSMDALSIDELKDVLAAVTNSKKKIDILGMDACFMSMGEVGYEIRDFVNIMIGAEGLEPALGWPYGRILADAKAYRESARGKTYPNRTAREFAGAIVKSYVDHYADYDRAAGLSVDLAAMDLRKIQGVKDAFEALVKSLEKFTAADHDKLLLAHWYAQTYKFDQFVDLMDLCSQIQKQFGHGELWNLCEAVITALKECIISSGCSGFAYQYSYGLSIYFPWAFVSADYRNLQFPRQTNWYEFIKAHVQATQRAPRFACESEKDFPALRCGQDLTKAVTARQEKLDEAFRESLHGTRTLRGEQTGQQGRTDNCTANEGAAPFGQSLRDP